MSTTESDDTLKAKLERGDELMANNKPEDALRLYKEAWDVAGSETEEGKVWILLSTANSAIRCRQASESKDALGKAYAFVHTGILLGNPIFHLLVGLTHHLRNEDTSAKDENFAKALICGGLDIFKGEDGRHLEKLMKHLDPPEHSASWDEYEGCSLDTMNGATGFLASLIEERLGKPLPYEAVDMSDDSESDGDYDSEDDEEDAKQEDEGDGKQDTVTADEDEPAVAIADNDVAGQQKAVSEPVSEPNSDERESKRQKCDD